MPRNNLFIIIAVLLILAAGFYFVNSTKKSTVSPVSTDTTTPTDTSTPSANVKENGVIISASGFTPQIITIKTGSSITWTNTDSASHTVNSDPHPTHTIYSPLNQVGIIKAGESKSLTFPAAGTYKYHDHLNPSSSGTVIVE